ncbi:MAG: RNA polymerase sigma factor, partial [Phycisphaerae bacterium]
MSAEWQTTSTILEGLRDFENARAWQDFSARFRGPIVSLVRRMGLTEAEADDVAQETLIHFADGLRAQKYDREKGRLSRWLFGIAYRQALNARRKRGRALAKPAQFAPGAAEALPDETELSNAWDQEWESCLLARCIAQMQNEVEPATFQAFVLVVQQGLPP